MASTIKVDEIEGSTGSTVTVPSGQTLTVSGTLGATSGANLTALNATEITSGTIVSADRLPTVTPTKGGTNQTTWAVGDLLYANGVNTLTKLTKPGSTMNLQMTSAGVPSWAAAAGGGAWTLISRQTASTSANLTVTGLDSTYDMYAVALSDMSPVDTSPIAWLRFGDSSGIDSGATDYDWWVGSANAAWEVRNSSGDSEIEICHQDGVGNDADAGYSGMFWLTGNNSTSTMQNSIFGNHQMMAGNGTTRYSGISGGMRKGTHITLTQIQFLFATGNISSGQMTVWGIKHT